MSSSINGFLIGKDPDVLITKLEHVVINPGSGARTAVRLGLAPVLREYVELLEVMLPNSIYNVRSGNNLITWTHGGTFTYTIPPGAYTASALCTVIAAGMNAADANTYTVVYNPNQFTVTFSGTGAFVLNFSVAGSPAVLLGFPVADTVAATTVTGPGAVTVGQPLAIYIRVEELGVLTKVTNQATGNCQPYAFRVPLTAESGGLVVNEYLATYRQRIYNETGYPKSAFGTLTCTLCYEDGTTVGLNGLGYQFVLGFR